MQMSWLIQTFIGRILSENVANLVHFNIIDLVVSWVIVASDNGNVTIELN